MIHLHKYWWSLFENLGLYYDTAAQFPKPVVADEFGGNYLDGRGDPGGYPTLPESFLRFLGRGHDRGDRLALQAESNSRVAEYWRRLGAAGFSPFCALSGPEDGNHHFMGPLPDGRPKPVWPALTAAYSALSCSLEVWDRNLVPSQDVALPVWLINDTDLPSQLSATVRVNAEPGTARAGRSLRRVTRLVPAHGMATEAVALRLPAAEGDWRFRAVLRRPPRGVRHPVVSSWRFRTIAVRVPPVLRGVSLGVPDGEEELLAFLRANALDTHPLGDPAAAVLVTSAAAWRDLNGVREALAAALAAGRSVLMLDAGPRLLGRGYRAVDDPGPLQAAPQVRQAKHWSFDLLHGVGALFREAPEPESCVHPTDEGTPLWWNLRPDHTRLWNGLRGGLIVPAAEMELAGLCAGAFSALWRSRGADPAMLRAGSYYAFELAGFYTFAPADDGSAREELRARVRFLVEDAPSLRVAVNPDAEVKVAESGGGISGRAARRGDPPDPPGLLRQESGPAPANGGLFQRYAGAAPDLPIDHRGTAGPGIWRRRTLRPALRSGGRAIRPEHAGPLRNGAAAPNRRYLKNGSVMSQLSCSCSCA